MHASLLGVMDLVTMFCFNGQHEDGTRTGTHSGLRKHARKLSDKIKTHFLHLGKMEIFPG